MAEECSESTAFSIGLNRHPHQESGQYEDGDDVYTARDYMTNSRQNRDDETIYVEEEVEEASISEIQDSHRKAVADAAAANNRKYTFIYRPKAQTFVCEYCSKELRYRSKYLEHLRIHTGERPFNCNYCGIRFTQRGALKQHERIHTGIKPHYCLTCDKSFRTASALNVHLKTHPSTTDTVIAGFGTALRDPYFEDHARIDEELAYEAAAAQQQQQEEEEYVQIYEPHAEEEEATTEFTHRWNVSHINQPVRGTTELSEEPELRLARFPDGRLQINDTIIEGEHFPMDGITFYYYTLPSNEILTFLYDDANNTLEIVESNDGDGVPEHEVVPQSDEVLHYEEHYEDEPHEGAYVYEEVIPESVPGSSTSQYEKVYVDDKEGAKDIPSAEYIIDPVHVIDVEQINELQDNKDLINVVSEPIEISEPIEMTPEAIAVNKTFYAPIPRRHRKPKNLEWIINAVAAGKKLDDATPHKRKKPTIMDCEICGLTLKYPSKIAAHMRTHTGEKPFVCEICGTGFAMNTTLRMHVRRHLQKKEYRCTYPNCTKSFVNGALLNPTGDGIRTQKDDLRVLDHPDFISSFAYKDFYYVWFRERASESSEDQIYSRVGRVCRNDNGGPSTTQDRWSSFLKARLNCSVPADVPFYFNELQSISEPIPQNDGDAIVYAVFSTSRSAVLMNAVCAFKMSAIDRVFNHGNFKTQRSVSSYSTQKSQNIRGTERPGKCPKDSRSVGDISFILKNPLMSDLVNAIDQPLLVEGPSKPDLTKVIAIGGVKAVERNQSYDVIYVGRNDGKVIKLIKTPQGDSVMIESIAVFDNPPTGIQALRPLFESNELVVVGSDRVAKIPLYHCDKQTSCSRCVALRDPHCAWDTENLVCIHSNDWNFGSFVQNIGKGSSSQCPESSAGDIEGYAINASPIMDSTKEFRQLLDEAEDDGFSVTTIAMIIICAVLMATGLGFLIGYRISKWRFLSEIQTAHSSGSSSNGSDYDSFGRARLTRHDSLTTTSKLGGDLYTMGQMGPKMSDAVSLVIGHQHIPVLTSISNAGSGYTTPHHRLEHSAMLITNGSTGGGSAGSAASHAPSCTLPRDYKVKKVYL